MPKRKAHKINNRLLIFTSIIMLLVGCLFLYALLKLNKNEFMNQTEESVQTNQTLALLNYVPNFDNLTVEDLPNVSSNYTEQYAYNENLLILGRGKIVEYDPKLKKIIRASDRSVIPCSAGVIIGDYIYFACNKSQKIQLNSSLTYGVLYKVNLVNGLLIKTYFDNPTPLPNPVDPQNFATTETEKGRRINIYLAAKDSDLYISSYDGVSKMDVSSESLTSYSVDQVFENRNCTPAGVFNENGKIIVISNQTISCWGAISVLDEATNKWTQFLTDTKSTDQKEDLYISEHKLYKQNQFSGLPTFFSISPKVNDMYYILATDGIYTLKRNEFPQLARKVKLYEQYFSKSVFSKDGKYLLFVGPDSAGGGDTWVEYWVNAVLINLQTLSIKNLTTSPVKHDYSNFSNLEWINASIDKAHFDEKDGTISLKDNNNVVLTVNLSTGRLNLGKQPSLK